MLASLSGASWQLTYASIGTLWLAARHGGRIVGPPCRRSEEAARCGLSHALIGDLAATLSKRAGSGAGVYEPHTKSLWALMIFGIVSGKMEASKMSDRTKPSLVNHRARLARRGFVRVEVNVSKHGASLVRQVAAALSDPARQVAARVLLRQRFVEPPKVSLKELLASAPLDGIDLDRGPDLGREVDL
jgi:hypothetical protein